MTDTPSDPAVDRVARRFEAVVDELWDQYDRARRDAVKADLKTRGIDPDSLSPEEAEYYFG